MSTQDEGRPAPSEGSFAVGPFGFSLRQYGVFTLDADGVITGWNPGAELMVGYRAGEVVGQPVSILYTDAEIAAGQPQWSLREADQHGSVTDEGWQWRKDGSRFWVNTVTSVVRSADGVVRGYAKISRDETEYRERLERSLRLFSDLFGLTPVGIGLFDRRGAILDANDALCDLLKYPRDALVGVTVADLVPAAEPRRESLLAAFEAGEMPDVQPSQQWPIVRTDGQHAECELHISKSEQPSGDPFWLVVFQDVTERHKQAEEMRYRATHDQLTGLPNLAAVGEMLGDAQLDRLAMIYSDIDAFHRVNDSLGHRAGDELLVALSKRLASGVPEGWIVARGGGDEFLVICPDVPANGGLDAVTNLVSGLLRASVHLQGEVVHVTSSLGIAVASDLDTSSDDLVRFASAANVEARKALGAEQISMAGPRLIEATNRQLRLEAKLREAIDTNGLVLHYQPLVTSNGSICAAEALVRWQHPHDGLIPADVFLPVARRTGMLREIDKWALRTALAEASNWPASGGKPVSINVNLGALTPDDPGLVDEVTAIIGETGIDWRRVVLELVETSLFEISPRARESINELTRRGIRFAVDDFGTGYSAFNRVKDFPPAILKIDREFVAHVDTNSADFALVHAIVDMAHAMSCRCTAEGVERPAQFRMLRDIGGDTFQGWLFSKAVPADDFRQMLAAGVGMPL